MENKFSPENIKKATINLIKVHAEKIETELQNIEFTIKRLDKYEILEMRPNGVSLKFTSEVSVEPEALFMIDFEYKAVFEFNHKIDAKFVESNINDMLQPIGNETSYIISTMTKLMNDTYIIIPPIVSISQ
jgi:hypothetical protein